MNILIKLSSLVGLVMAPLLVDVHHVKAVETVKEEISVQAPPTTPPPPTTPATPPPPPPPPPPAGQ